jgi:putative N-acetyltransferase (TIGR04045 family)
MLQTATSYPATQRAPWEICELDSAYSPRQLRVQWASDPWMHRQAHALRREVFCEEQGLFGGDDLDEIDRTGTNVHLLVALSCLAGDADEVVGTVRIHESAPGLWWGSRLAVQSAWRTHRGLGSTLIRLAVSSANALGCETFLAHVQSQNVRLFERLHWAVRDEVVLHGRPHALMQADLGRYPPCRTPCAGFVIADGSAS